MLRTIVSLILLVLATGCANSSSVEDARNPDGVLPYKTFLANNRMNISRLQLGMTRMQVIDLMKSYTSEVGSGQLLNPYRSSAFVRGEQSYEILYYLTEPYRSFRPISDSQATPVVLVNGVVVGWGRTAVADLGLPQP